MTLSTTQVVIFTLTVLTLVSGLYFSRVEGVVSGGDLTPDLPCDFPVVARRAFTAEPWIICCEPQRGNASGTRNPIR